MSDETNKLDAPHHVGLQCIACGKDLLAEDKVVYGEKSYLVAHAECMDAPKRDAVEWLREQGIRPFREINALVDGELKVRVLAELLESHALPFIGERDAADRRESVAMKVRDKCIQELRKAESERDALRGALKLLMADAPIVECESFHHDKADRHTGFDCPVHKRWRLAISTARAALENRERRVKP